jgi:hypothetical protein
MIRATIKAMRSETTVEQPAEPLSEECMRSSLVRALMSVIALGMVAAGVLHPDKPEGVTALQ